MKVFTDESGGFSVTCPGHNSVVCSLIVPETVYTDLLRSFIQFENRLAPAEKTANGEVKGSSISVAIRRRFCKFIGRNWRHLTVVTVLASSDIINEPLLKRFRARQAEIFLENKELYIRRGGNADGWLKHFDRLAKIAEFSSRLSDEEFLQALTFMESVPHILQVVIGHYLDDSFKESFRSFDFVIDRKLETKLSAMEKYIDNNLLDFLVGDSKKGLRSIDVPLEWRSDHPFSRFLLDEGIALEVIFENGLQFKDSKDLPGLRMADIISNTVYLHLNHPEDSDIAECYQLMRPAMDSISRAPITGIELCVAPRGYGLSYPGLDITQ